MPSGAARAWRRAFFFCSFFIARFKTPLVLRGKSDALLLPLRTLEEVAVAALVTLRRAHSLGGCVAEAGAGHFVAHLTLESHTPTRHLRLCAPQRRRHGVHLSMHTKVG